MKKLIPLSALIAFALLPGLGCHRQQTVELSQRPAHGTSFLLEVNAAAGDTNILPQVKSAMETRFSVLGVKIFWEPVSTTRARILAPITDEKIEIARDCIVRPGVLEFRLMHTNSDNLVLQGSGESGYELVRDPHRSPEGRVVSGYLIEKKPQLTGKYITHASGLIDARGKPEIEFTLNSEGTTIFAEVTKENFGRKLAIIVDGQFQSAPVIQAPIENGAGVISGQFSDREVLKMATAISCSLPAPVTLVESKTF